MLDTPIDPGIENCFEEGPLVVTGRCALTELRGRRVQRTERFGSRRYDSIWELREAR